MKIEVEVRDQAGPFVRTLFNRQVPFATALALNETAKDFQNAPKDMGRAVDQDQAVRHKGEAGSPNLDRPARGTW
jgi:hypothetical protein